MAKKTPHPYVVWRDGRPRFVPNAGLRRAGHKGRDLRHDDGRWFTRGEAVDWSEAFVAGLAKARKAARPQRRAAASGPALYTLDRLFEDWQQSAKFQLPDNPHELRRQVAANNVYSPKTVRYYKQKLRTLREHDPSLVAAPVDALTTPIVVGLYDELVAERGLTTARGAIVVLGIAIAWGRRRGRFALKLNGGLNPARDIGMAAPPPRLRIGSKAELAALMGAADALDWPEMGDMLQLGLWTGQRQEDRLLLVDKGLLNGRRIFRQQKTGAVVAIREAPALKVRLAASAARRAAAGIVNPRVVLDEQPGERGRAAWVPFPDDGGRYRKRFAELRDAAAAGIPDEAATAALAARWQAEGRNSTPPVVWKVAPAPTLLGDTETGVLRFYESDLRTTAVCWMALGEATIPEIISVTGHTVQSATQILKHYLATHPEMADSAIAKMVAFYEGDSEAEFV
ncbi:MAG: hypothetical protein KIS96_14560 [Bauldia sp.]|nr:hypothetical protein [Bauldia sp.]